MIRKAAARCVLAFAMLIAGATAARAACVCGYEDGLLTKVTITIDGLMGDWASSIADGDNVSCDAVDATDRDHPVQSTGRNLESVVETEDAGFFYMWTRRVGSANNTQNFIYYADTNLNDIMELGEPVVVALWQGNTGNVNLRLYTYDDLGSGGDSMFDIDGFADGYSLPGDLNFVKNLPADSGQGATTGPEDGFEMEWRLAWADLGLPPGGTLKWHVSSTNSNPGAAGLGAQVDDNLGGCGGMCSGTNESSGIGIIAQGTSEIGQILYSAHELSNDGNIDDVFDLTWTSTGDWVPVSVNFYEDLGTVGQYDAGVDVLLTDTDGDPDPDTGTLPAGSSFDLLIAIEKPVPPTTGTATVTATATSNFVPACAPPGTLPFSEDMIEVIAILETDLAITKDDGVTEARPGFDVTYSITVTNNGPDDAVDAAVVDTFNATQFEVANLVWTCTITTAGSGTDACDDPGPTNGDINTTVDLSNGAVATFTVTAPIQSSATGTLSNTVTVTAADIDPISGNDSATDGDTVLLPLLRIVKRAYRFDGTAIADGTTLAIGTQFRFLLYINNEGPLVADASLQDVLDPGFTYVAGSMRYDSSLSNCASSTCTPAEEDAIFAAADLGTPGTDALDPPDPVSYSGSVLDAGNENAANAQIDLPADGVWAIVFTVTMG